MKPNRFFRRLIVSGSSIHYNSGWSVPLQALTGASRPAFALSFAAILISFSDAAIFGGAPGASPANPQPGSAPIGGTTPNASDATRANARETMLRTSQAVGAMKALQDAARAAAAASNIPVQNPNNPAQTLPNIPNGLAPGGLQPLAGGTWLGAKPAESSTINGLTGVTIKQTAQQALLNWQTFNVGKNTTLTFDQSAGGGNASQWIAFNKVTDPTANPTQILGQIKAQGQVYIINPNGIIFGGSSQINVHTLTASTLPINDNLVARGLLNNPTQEFLFNGLGASNKIGDVTVESGAKISTPVSADGNGGRIALIGANVKNSGTLSSPAGQVILAAGLQVGLAAHASTDPSLRGLDVFVGAVTDPASVFIPYAGTVTNEGIIEIARASTVLTGRSVTQNGVIDGSTSVSLNGRIDLLANYGAVPNPAYNPNNAAAESRYVFQSTGSVTLGNDSITRILPETTTTDTAIGTELALRSQINVQGRTIHLEKNSEILAPNAKVSLQAGRWATIVPNQFASLIADGGQVYLDSGASINLAGTTNAYASVTQNFITLVLRGSELAVAPLQRDGVLRGDEITIDISKTGTYNGRDWIGTPLADVSGFVALIQRDVSQLTTRGGSLDISAGGSVVLQQGSSIDVSGGWTNFTSATVSPTSLISNGRIIDISEATPDQIYSGILSPVSTVIDPKWGVVEIFGRPLAPTGSRIEAGYTQGADAGAISISAPAMALDGNLLGTTVTGPKQIRATSTSANLPASGAITVRFQAQLQTGSAVYTWYPGKPDVIFGDDQQEPADAFAVEANGEPLAPSRNETVYLSPKLFSEKGFGRLTVENNEGNILLPEDVALNREIGGSLTLKAKNIDILGDITAPGGSVSFTAYNISPYIAATLVQDAPLPAPAVGKGIVNLGANATINAAGLIKDDRMIGNAAPLQQNGGSVTIAAYTANLAAGGVINVSGGYLVNSAGRGSFGNAGAIAVRAGQDQNSNLAGVVGGELNLGADLLGYSGKQGGTLSLQAAAVQIGGSSSTSGALVLQPDFFSQGGFSAFNISGLGSNDAPAVLVADGTEVTPVVKSYVAASGKLGLSIYEDTAGVRQPVRLNLTASGVRDFFRGNAIIGAGSVLRTDPGGSISVSGDTVSILGSLITPGGAISIAGGNSTATALGDSTQALVTTYLGPDAVLSATGTTVLLPDAHNRRIGSVLGGGTITLGGNIAAVAGALIDVSGTSGILDLDPAVLAPSRAPVTPIRGNSNSDPYNVASTPTRIDSNGGNIVLRGGQMLLTDATLRANAGGSTALGGTLSISSGRYDPPGVIPPASAIQLTVKQQGPLISGAAGIGSALGNGGHFTIGSFASGGFDSLTLGGVVSFEGAIDATVRSHLRVATGGFIYANSIVSLTAAYASLGLPQQAPALPNETLNPFGAPFSPTFGTGSLNVTADQIDLGSLSLQNIGSASLTANNGDIRGSGTLHISGNLDLTAAQIYPLTATNLSFIAYDHGSTSGTISIHSSGNRQLPLSGGGTLGIYASVINQQGTLRAPFGTIHLGWDGTGTPPKDLIAGTGIAFPVTSQLTLASNSVTSASAVDPFTGNGIIIPYGVSTDGENWIDPRGIDIATGGAPEKSIILSGKNVVTATGSSIDLRGGGDLYAYRFTAGLGGLTDILVSNNSFAILPDYQSDFAPASPFNASTSDNNLIGDNGPGYVNSSLQAGDRIFLAGSATLAEGYYTLLPARYALLPGAVLVSASAGNGRGTIEMPDQSSLVSGFRFNGLNDERTPPTTASRFELASSKVIRQRATYQEFLANNFLKNAAQSANLAVPRLPLDSGQLVFQATQTMSLSGNVFSKSISSGRGSLIDISTPLDTFIVSPGTTTPAGAIVLDAATLNAFGAESLLIGGSRGTNSSITVRTGGVTVDNGGSPLTAQDVILVAKDRVDIAEDAEITAIGGTSNSQNFSLVGNGALLRVSSDANAQVIRTGATNAIAPVLAIGENATLTGISLILDSTSSLDLDPSANLLAKAFTLSSGRISLLLDNAASLLPGSGLVITNSSLAEFNAAKSLSLLSYSSIDIYGSGNLGNPSLSRLALSAGEIRGVQPAGGIAKISADEILLQNTANGSAGAVLPIVPGILRFDAPTIRLGANQLAINGYSDTIFNASRGIIGEGTGGISTSGSLTANTAVLTGAAGAKRNISASGNLVFNSASGTPINGGLGSSLTITGSSVDLGSKIILQSGSLNVHANTGNINVSGVLDASGASQAFHDVTKFTSAGEISLTADLGNVLLANGSIVDISAKPAGGDAGTLSISAALGNFTSAGTIRGQGGNGGTNGSFELDTSSLAALFSLSETLTKSHLTESQKFRVRNDDVVIDGSTIARNFSLSADRGSVSLTGAIDASGSTGGTVSLSANKNLTLASGSKINAAGQVFSNAGKGGDVSLAAGSQLNGTIGNGMLDIQTGSTIDLSVAAKDSTSASKGQFSGKLHLRAPQTATFNDLRIEPINGTITDPSSIVAEGYRLYDLTSTNGTITAAVQNQIKTDAADFLGEAKMTIPGYTAMTGRLLGKDSPLESLFVIAPGAEIINRSGNLTLGTASSTTTSDWDLSSFRFGSKSTAGILTLRAAGDIVFYNALSDGFTPTLASSDPAWLWTARLSEYNAALPANAQSWSYHLAAGADLTSADRDQTSATATGSLKLGKTGNNLATGTGASATTASAIANRFQVIRTGSGDIDINAARDVQILNHFSTIYTAGTRLQDFTLGGTFGLPNLSLTNISATLGNAQQSYAVLYSSAGGDVRIQAGRNIERLTLAGGNLVADSQFQMPSNWLYRRGLVDPITGEFGVISLGSVNTPNAASTTWWIDFSNFFQGVGALGGGDVSLIAGNNISNIDAVIPTNARMPGYTDGSQTRKARPDASKLVELGGGDLLVKAGSDIDAGVYYIERGDGTLTAGGSIHTNSTRSVLAQSNIDAGQATPYTELPTTLFLGKGGFEIDANGSVLLGPVANPFLLPGGLLNSFRNKSYFSTYSADSYVDATSLGGNVTLRGSATLPSEGAGGATSLLQSWYTNKLLFSAAARRPWLRLNETSTAPFSSLFSLQPATLSATAFSGDINIVGNITLSPSFTGQLELLASGSFNALQPNGVVTVNGVRTTAWGSSTINLSDADPTAIPGISNPFGFPSFVSGDALFLESVNRLFRESGATIGENTVLQIKQALHAPGVLHAENDEPVRIYTGSDDISGLTLFSAKSANILAGRDISDVAFYIQNTGAKNTSIVASGRDLTPYNSSSQLRISAQSAGNVLNTQSIPQAGDIQISGPGSLQVLAGADLDLGTGPNNPDGTGTGITSIGNTRNPHLPFDGANLMVAAGIGAADNLSNSGLQSTKFISKYVTTPEGQKYLDEISDGLVLTDLTDEEQAGVALQVFYLVLRDAGRDYFETGNYDAADAAIASLFGDDYQPTGNIFTRGRDIRTNNGGDISILTPAGGVQLANTTIGNPLSPPGIITASGGNISIFTKENIDIGIGRIFTLRGGNEILFSSDGDIAAGSSSKTVQSAPPTRVLIDPQSASVQTDLSGLATGGGIGVLATVTGITPGNVDLIAPNGSVDAGDAGIRSAGNLNIAANQVINGGNITTGGTSTGTPAAVSVSANVTAVGTASNAAAAATTTAQQRNTTQPQKEELKAQDDFSLITVEVLGYGGAADEDDEEQEKEPGLE